MKFFCNSIKQGSCSTRTRVSQSCQTWHGFLFLNQLQELKVDIFLLIWDLAKMWFWSATVRINRASCMSRTHRAWSASTWRARWTQDSTKIWILTFSLQWVQDSAFQILHVQLLKILNFPDCKIFMLTKLSTLLVQKFYLCSFRMAKPFADVICID